MASNDFEQMHSIQDSLLLHRPLHRPQKSADKKNNPDSLPPRKEKMILLLSGLLELTREQLGDFLKALDNKEITGILCYDMGCGNTSAAYIPIHYDETDGTINIGNSELVLWKYDDGTLSVHTAIPTIIGYAGKNPVVGPDALKWGNTAQNFKALPTKAALQKTVLSVKAGPKKFQDFSLREIWQDYFRQTRNMAIAWLHNDKRYDINPLRTLISVAHPSGGTWSRQSILSNYRELITETGFIPDSHIVTISEAKAAMLYAAKGKNQKLNIDFECGVLIIDLGASTIDIEFLIMKYPNPIEYSLTLAGREVDLLLAHHILADEWKLIDQNQYRYNQIPTDNKFYIQNFGMNQGAFLYKIRCFKEQLSDTFTVNINDDNILKSAVAFSCPNRNDANHPYHAEVSPKDLQSLLNGPMFPRDTKVGPESNTWLGHLQDFFTDALEDLKWLAQKENFSIDEMSIIMTGGTARLIDVRETLTNALKSSGFGDNGLIDRIYCMDNPREYEEMVPFGSAIYLGTTLQHLGDLTTLPDEIDTPVEKDTVNELVRLISNVLFEDVFDPIICAAFTEWCDPKNQFKWNEFGGKTSIQGCKDILGKKTNNIPTEKIEAALQKSTSKFTTSLREQAEVNRIFSGTQEFCDDFLKKLSGKQHSHQLSGVQLAEITLPINNIVAAVRNTFNPKNTNSLNLLSFFLPAVNLNIPRTEAYRKKAFESYKNDDHSKSLTEMQNAIRPAVTDAYKSNNGFGLPETIFDGLLDDIKRSLYLS